eukprot:CAMPEP_0178984436 /NCGR_PEP_ID=MMETSP0795-20121207/1602_1 /TAXON_ID=88552 /ORGANISM="Amoebophrya sp., Strain Ameob2" /LENGTH=851 /DNA_ID=CAMNT_0020675295 /DNA_START=61 /DNA_END=2617 /DNA_ORIENTATION=-
MADNIKVCIRCRPFNKRELEMQSEKCVEMPSSTQICIFDPTEEGGARNEFAYDRCFWSTDDSGFEKADQVTLQQEIGEELLDNAVKGYNDTLFAYGQTGSGKTWSVIGGADIHGPDAGLVPRLITNLFQRMSSPEHKAMWKEKITVSYLEIYNEQLRDLLAPKPVGGHGSKLHPTLGIFVPGMIEAAVTSDSEVMKMLDFGFSQRAVAETSMNPRSSRSHTIFTISVTLYQGKLEKADHQLSSKINMVDLAGSERQKKTNAEGDHLKEGAAINQSLSNLALVIHSLAAQQTGKVKKHQDHVPYRNSKLTHFLQPALSGNSKTVMIAAVSPALTNIQETLSTLRFANSAKEIKTKPSANATTNLGIVEQLKEQIRELQKQLAAGGGREIGGGGPVVDPELLKEIQELKALKEKFGESFEEHLANGALIRSGQQRALQEAGLAVADDPNAPGLISVSSDATLSGKLCLYITKPNLTVGTEGDVRLQGLGITKKMCVLSCKTPEQKAVVMKLLPDEVEKGKFCVPRRAPQRLQTAREFGAGHFGAPRPAGVREGAGVPGAHPKVAAERETALEHVDADFDDLIGELIDTHSAAFFQTKEFIETIAEHLGADNAEEFLRTFAQCLPLVNEANEISKNVRPNDRLLLRLDVLIDPLCFKNSKPAICVRMYKFAPEEDGEFEHEQDHPRREYITNTHAHLSEDQDDIFVDGVIDKRAVAELAVFSWPNFLTRLHAMREVYDDFHHGKKHDWDVEPDPWGEMSYFDHHEHHVEKNLHASARQSAVEAAESLMMQQGDLASSKGAGARGLAAAQKKGNLDLEAVAQMSHAERQEHAQALFKRLRESLSVLRRELELDSK